MTDLSLLQDFIAETGEHLEEMETNLLRLETDTDNREILNDIFRSAHTIKGSAEYLGMERIAGLSHKLENLLEILRHGGKSPDKEIINTLIDSKDRIAMLIQDVEKSQTETTEIGDLIRRIDELDIKSDHDDPDREEDVISDELIKDLFEQPSSSPVQPAACDDIDIDIGKAQQHYDTLKVVLYEMARGDVSDEKKKRLTEMLDAFIRISVCGQRDDVVKRLESLKNQAAMISFPDDAGDLLADLHRFMNLLLPSSHSAGTSDVFEPENFSPEEDAETSAPVSVPDETAVVSLFEENNEESYEEEHDSELFDIFIQHLKENISLVRQCIAELRSSENKNGILGKCIGHINSLHSSANYMDYKKLTRFYEQWIQDIEAAQKNIFTGVFKGKSVEDGMNVYLNEIIKRFSDFLGPDFRPAKPPEKTAVTDTSHESETEDLLLSPDTETDDYEGLLAADIMDEFEKEIPDKAEESEDLPITLTAEVKEQDIQDAGISDEAVRPEKETEIQKDTVNYQGLFDELDDVFDSDSGTMLREPDSEPDIDSYHEDVEERLISRNHVSEKPMLISRSDEEKITPAPVPAPEFGNERNMAEISLPEDKSEQAVQSVSELIETEKIYSEPGSEKIDTQSLHPEKVMAKHSLRVDTRKIDSLMNQVGELVVSRAWFSQLYSEMKELQDYLQDTVRLGQREMKPVKALTFRISEATVALGRVANELQEGVMKVRMLPIAQLFNRYPRLVRDLTHNTDKQVRLEIVGEETELDKMVIEEISDPMIHIIRNAVDHGCETIEERRRKGKPEEFTLRLESYHESNHVVIEISDDGRGIDPKLIKQKALEKNFFTQEELDRMPLRELISIIMKPGFSTAKEVTKTSGRGVGMDVVKKNVEKLNGTIEVDSKVGVGTRFRIKIPLTLAIIRALLVRVGADIFTIPLASVEETLRVFENEITVIEGVEVIHLRDSTLSLIRLSEVFGIESLSPDPGKLFVVVVNTGMRQAGLVVDALIGQEEAVIKPLVDYLQENSGFSGATILGDGRISLIVDVYELINMSVGRQVRRKNEITKNEMMMSPDDRFGSQSSYEHRTLH